MYMRFDRQPSSQRNSHARSAFGRNAHSATADATGTPFTARSMPDGARPTTERLDFREQADGAP